MSHYGQKTCPNNYSHYNESLHGATHTINVLFAKFCLEKVAFVKVVNHLAEAAASVKFTSGFRPP